MPTFSPFGSEWRIAAKVASSPKAAMIPASYRMPLVRAIAGLLAAFSLQCAAAPFGLQIGDVRIGFDLPPGFADSLPTGSPRLQELAESFTPAPNRILIFALTDADMRRFSTGDVPELRQYLLVVTPRALEFERMSASAFESYVNQGLRSLGNLPGDGDYLKILEERPPGESILLAELRREADAVAVLRGLRLKGVEGGLFTSAKPSQYVLSTTSVVLLRGKPIHLTVATGYESKSDVEWIRVTTLRWIDELRRLNASR